MEARAGFDPSQPTKRRGIQQAAYKNGVPIYNVKTLVTIGMISRRFYLELLEVPVSAIYDHCADVICCARDSYELSWSQSTDRLPEKFQNRVLGGGSPHSGVDDFVTAKALSFNKIQSTSTGGLQTIQQESLRINKIQ
jgi:hypothetical protein